MSIHYNECTFTGTVKKQTDICFIESIFSVNDQQKVYRVKFLTPLTLQHRADYKHCNSWLSNLIHSEHYL